MTDCDDATAVLSSRPSDSGAVSVDGESGPHRLSVPTRGSHRSRHEKRRLNGGRISEPESTKQSAYLNSSEATAGRLCQPVLSAGGGVTKSRSLGCLMSSHPNSGGYATPPTAPLLTAQQRRAAFQNSSAGPSPKLPRSERNPSVIVSDHSTGDSASLDSPGYYATDGEWIEGVRRLSSCSSCSTVSSCGCGPSRRGSLVDLEAEGLVLHADGRLERDSLERRRSSELKRRSSLDPNWPSSLSNPTETDLESIPTPTKSLDLDISPARVLRQGTSAGGTGEVTDMIRKASDCSISSIGTLSQDDDDDSDNRDDVKADVSLDVAQLPHWRKVKGIVQWTPFVQTFRNQKYPWVQLAGHQGNFRAGEDGTILKRLCGREQVCLQALMHDALRPHVPEYRGSVQTRQGETFLQLQDLLSGFREPCVMDCKIGVRTYQEDELAKAREKPKLRKDMYEKMMLIDQTAPTQEEHRLKAVTKPRYMVWRETISSTATLGFRIEGIRRSDGYSSKDFKTTRTHQQVQQAMALYTEGYPHAAKQHLACLERIRSALAESEFFKSHEFIGSSLLFVHDAVRACVWMIDFAKTSPLPAGVEVTHHTPWVPGNHEDGYIIGIDHLIGIFRQLATQ